MISGRLIRAAVTSSVVLVIMGTPALVPAQPAVTSVTGLPQAGAHLTISGSGFGTKGVAAPLKYDDFEGGTLGSSVSGWATTSGGADGNLSLTPTYSNTQLRTNSNKSLECSFWFVSVDSNQYGNNFGMTGDTSESGHIDGLLLHKVYMDVWYYYKPYSTPSRNHKPFRLHSNTGGSGQPNEYYGMWCEAGAILSHDGGGSGAWLADSLGITYFQNRWRHIQFWTKESSPGLSDGDVRVTLDNTVALDSISHWNTRAADSVHYWAVWMGNYLGHDAAAGCSASQGNSYTYWDNAYIDTTWAHVEIGNASTYRACTQTEIQVPTAWSPTSIAITVNQGAFGSLAGEYVYVTNANGQVNAAGYPLGTGSGDIVSPAPIGDVRPPPGQ